MKFFTLIEAMLPIASFQLRVQIIASTQSDERRFLYLLRMRDPMLNADSDATVVTGMLSKSQAIIERCGNLGLLVFHQSSTSICAVKCKFNVASSK